jgi:hypothetical protein
LQRYIEIACSAAAFAFLLTQHRQSIKKKTRNACALRAGVSSTLFEIGFLYYGADSAPQTGIRHFASHNFSAS